ncbi:Regulation of nuclear pre-mRNA domain-containing protein 2 [Trachymyrmex zeteki]|uniref:Regulation of nuclear pre-mRNA domain-containing protein 2 n=2 Tax=Mycetomoellerius zeteki TaxID=64791 RepID=A0A151WGA7_9HYME|nr:Regulation of nuclear pre-mRNA domain-containing protein 2 [Trachymyrmex zeteki]
MANDFDAEQFERRLHSLKDSQESIQGLSAWCLDRRQHHKKIVTTWLQVLKKVKVEHRLTLFYLANDVIQYSKRKNFEFVESWGTTLQRATPMVRDEKVKHRILRIFKIWDQRQVYDEEFLADLSGLISAAPKKKLDPPPTTQPEEFQAALLISTMRSCATLEQATDARLRDLRESNIDIESAEELRSSLKDRRRMEDAEKEIDLVARNVENYVRALEAEIRERAQVVELLDQADQFYETQRGEVKIVTNAYRNFGSRVKNLKKKLDELLPTFVSPIPSPDINAPSPSPDSDIELPGDETQSIVNQSGMIDVAPPSLYGSYSHEYDPIPVPAPDMVQGNESADFTNNFPSFMGGNVDFGNMRNIFNETSETSPEMSQQYNESLEAKPIEVINMRPSKDEQNNADFNISSFLKTVLPLSDGTADSGAIPGLGLDVSENQVESPQRPSYSPSLGPVTPVISRMMSNQGTPAVSGGGGLNNCQMSHSTPISVRNLPESHTPSPYSSQNSQNNIAGPFDGPTNNTVNPLPPPPLPPLFLDDENCYNKLPPKFPTWMPANEGIKDSAKWEEKGKNSMNPAWPGECDDKNKNSWMDGDGDRWDSNNDSTWPVSRTKNDMLSETPESPPMYEKAGFAEPVEYNEPQPQESLNTTRDVDHRVIPMPMARENQLPYRLMKAADVDHRNLISLTGSPANNHNPGEPSSLSNNNNLWSTGDQDYRRHMQSGDIVESVDMEMSDDETDSKPKGRVLVDLRLQDRDMRVGAPLSSHHDMDMRMIPLPIGQMPDPHDNQLMQDMHLMRSGPPPPPPLPQFQHQGQGGFRQDQPIDFHPNQPKFLQNRPPNFLRNQDFHSNQQEFHQLHQSQQDFEYHDREHNIRSKQDFLAESPGRGRYSQSVEHQHQHDNPPFHRNEWNNRGGRGFPRNRRDRYSEDHNVQKQRNNLLNSRKSRSQDQQHHQSPSEIPPNNRPLLQPPDIAFDEKGIPIGLPLPLPEFDQDNNVLPNTQTEPEHNSDNCQNSLVPHVQRTLYDMPSSHDSECNQQQQNCQLDSDEQQTSSLAESEDQSSTINQTTVIPIRTDNVGDESQQKQHVPISECEEHVESTEHSDFAEKTSAIDELVNEGQNVNSMETESLDESMTLTTLNKEIKRTANGDCDEQSHEEGSPNKKRPLLQNGPPMLNDDLSGPNGPTPTTDLHPAMMYEFDGPNFRPRIGALFPLWRGGLPPPPSSRGGRGGFRGGLMGMPRGLWMDRGPRGPIVGNFSPRGLKRGGKQFWGGGFRGRGRGSNW